MKSCTWAGALVAACLLMPVHAWAAPDEAALLRIFLKDGSALVSFGEFARVGDRVVFSMPLNADAEPSLHLVNIAADRVDWDRTNRYADRSEERRVGKECRCRGTACD